MPCPQDHAQQLASYPCPSILPARMHLTLQRSSTAGAGLADLIRKLTAEAPAKKKTMPLSAKATVPCTAAAGGQPGARGGACTAKCHTTLAVVFRR